LRRPRSGAPKQAQIHSTFACAISWVLIPCIGGTGRQRNCWLRRVLDIPITHQDDMISNFNVVCSTGRETHIPIMVNCVPRYWSLFWCHLHFASPSVCSKCVYSI
jgi:hypothetical protein